MKPQTAQALRAAVLAAFAPLAPAAQAAGVPDALQPHAGESAAFTLAARGVQVYECRAAASGGVEWTFVAPDAELFDAAGRRAGTHGAGPFWQAADGSRVVAAVKARADAPGPGAIPWLLLTARNTGPQGLLSRVTSIQRIHTTGGVAPAHGCAAGTVGATARVPYTADYVMLAGEAAATDVVGEWTVRSAQLVAEAKLGTPPAVRVMATVQTAVQHAVDAASARPGTSVPAAVAAAHRAAMAALVPAAQGAIDAAYQQAVAALPDDGARTAGIAAGEQAARTVLAARAGDTVAPDAYRPATTPGAYVPTASPAASQWGQRKPWTMASPSQFRPGPPPALNSEQWARDYNEVKTLGARASTRRTEAQTEIARFWDYSLPAIYQGLVRSVAAHPGRDVRDNARLYAAAAQAMDDALIAVFDAKYQYNFWRPVTAIRNGDADGHDATERDASWAPLIDVPMHPEYPSAHAVLAGAVGAVVRAELAGRPLPILSTKSPTAKGAAVRHWTSVDDLVREVGEARIYEGVHFRTAVEVGLDMGRKIGEQAAAKQLAH